MKFNPQIHHRRSVRLKEYDYTLPGAYIITIGTWQQEPLFGTVVNSEMRLNQFGQIVQTAWNDLPNHYPHVELDAFCIMPDHIHAIIILTAARRGGSDSLDTEPDVPHSGTTSQSAITPTRPAPGSIPEPPFHTGPKRHGLPEIVRAFKTFSARRINTLRRTHGIPVWHRNYYEHIIRDEVDLANTRRYILHNPKEWENKHP